MKRRNNSATPNQATPDFVFSPPAMDLLYPGQDNYFWPERIRNNLVVKRDTAKRLKLSKELEHLFFAVNQFNSSTNDELTGTYNLLSDFIESASYNARLILYLPFELIPNLEEVNVCTKSTQAISRFRKVVTEKWLELLSNHDIRADFVDGDILEPELCNGELDLVNKAAHLLPVILSKGLLSISQTVGLVERADKVLRDSLLDALLVAFDLNLISEADLVIISKSTDSWLRNLPIIINSDLETKTSFKLKTEIIKTEKQLRELLQKASDEISLLETAKLKHGHTQARFDWEKKRDQDKIIDRYADLISNALTNDELSIDGFLHLTVSSESETAILVGICSLKKALIKIASVNLNRAQRISLDFKTVLLRYGSHDSPRVQGLLEETCLHWENLNIISKDWLEVINVKPLTLDSLFSWNEINFQSDKKVLIQALETINKDSELSSLLYPIILVYGSKVKGYNTKQADIDVAVFIRPSVSFPKRPYIQSLIKKLFVSNLEISSVLEFWLKKTDFGLRIEDRPIYDKLLGNSAYAHVFFNGMFFGKKELIKKFYEEIMINFLYSKGKLLDSQDANRLWLHELERDTLQYRLMHKGYAQARPVYVEITSTHADNIDGDSPFWDSGYRKIATQLFIKRVYLPQL